MHGQLGVANVNSADTSQCAQNGANSGSACAVVLNNKLLDGNVGDFSELLNDKSRDCGSGVSLVCVVFNGWSAVDCWLMQGLVVRTNTKLIPQHMRLRCTYE